MDPAIKKQILSAVIGLAVGVISTYAMVWRDVAVIRTEIGHIQSDIAVIQTFIANDDPREFIKAKETIRVDRKADHKE
jgi:hypothetical protein